MSTAYILCKKLIDHGHTEGLPEKIDVYYMAGRLTTEEYQELIELLTLND